MITGGAGFLGSHFLNYVVEKYSNLYFICIDKLNYASNYSTKLIKIMNNSNFKFIEKDLSIDFKSLQKIIKDFNVIQIINFAAESCVDKSFNEPLYFTKNNILSTQNLLECCRLSSNEIKFLHISTDEVYGEQNNVADDSKFVDENYKLNPTNPYAATKASIDLILKSYIYSYKLSITIIRSNNVYGYGQYPEKIIPKTIDTLLKRSKGLDIKIPIHGDGHYKRTYLYIKDFINAVELLWNNQKLNKYCNGEIFNVSGDVINNNSTTNDYEIENLKLVKLICDCYYKDQDYIFNDCIQFVKDRNYNDSRYLLDCSKITKLGWKPTITLHVGIPKLLQESV